MQRAAPVFLTICWPLFEMKAKENCRKPQWESHELVLFNVLHGLYLTERPFVWLKCSHKNTFSRRNIFFQRKQALLRILAISVFHILQKDTLVARSFFSGNLWKVWNTSDWFSCRICPSWFSNCSLLVHRGTPCTQSTRSDFFHKKQNKTSGRNWCSASVHCTTAQVLPAGLLWPQKMIEENRAALKLCKDRFKWK